MDGYSPPSPPAELEGGWEKTGGKGQGEGPTCSLQRRAHRKVDSTQMATGPGPRRRCLLRASGLQERRSLPHQPQAPSSTRPGGRQATARGGAPYPPPCPHIPRYSQTRGAGGDPPSTNLPPGGHRPSWSYRVKGDAKEGGQRLGSRGRTRLRPPSLFILFLERGAKGAKVALQEVGRLLGHLEAPNRHAPPLLRG